MIAGRAIIGRLRRVAGGRGGFTLIELMISTAMALIVVSAATKLFTSYIGDQSAATRATLRSTGRVMIDRLTRDLRQASTISPTASATGLTMTTPAGTGCATAPNCTVTYAVAAVPTATDLAWCTPAQRFRITRTQGAASTFNDLCLVSSSVFTYLPSSASATFVGVNLTLAGGSDGEAATLADGVYLRNAPS